MSEMSTNLFQQRKWKDTFFNKLNKLEVLDMGDQLFRSMHNTHNPLRVYLNKLWTSTGLVFNCIKFRTAAKADFLLVYGRNKSRQFFSICYEFNGEGHLKIPDGDVFFLLSEGDAAAVKSRYVFLDAVDRVEEYNSLSANEDERFAKFAEKFITQKQYTFSTLNELMLEVLPHNYSVQSVGYKAQVVDQSFAYLFYDLHGFSKKEKIFADCVWSYFANLRKYCPIFFEKSLIKCGCNEVEQVATQIAGKEEEEVQPKEEKEVGGAEPEASEKASPPALSDLEKEQIDLFLASDWSIEKIVQALGSEDKYDSIREYMQNRKEFVPPTSAADEAVEAKAEKVEEEAEDSYELV